MKQSSMRKNSKVSREQLIGLKQKQSIKEQEDSFNNVNLLIKNWNSVEKS